MRTLIVAEIDTEKSNELISSGKMPELMGEMLGKLRPEAAYFYPLNGHRGFTLVVDLARESSLVTTVEPLWLRMGAKVMVTPCMSADELRSGIEELRS
ncbi:MULTISPECIES: hypothetical protein [Kitasatospora]|uniref:Uncharacterized protein n=1 Tax=Kitasatospora setae (strain ATCC 33774 / DSM 43861 / JCM 3304 / KCC A-0304 / NBRC 14216 / KM-6054) TaxID=452652 RepID=E4N1V1_KITSK|nr:MULTISPECIES: hypothetical protein [Kitasatospora]BAJ32135.1 hypothetical protein KSE_63760 [Kitasatospora setae KM-6054]